MKTRNLLILMLAVAANVYADDAPVDSGIAEIEALGRINGQALACSEQAAASRAKEIILKHAPRTPRYGAAFEQATQRGFADQVKGRAVCPASNELVQRIELVAAELGRKLPPAQ